MTLAEPLPFTQPSFTEAPTRASEHYPPGSFLSQDKSRHSSFTIQQNPEAYVTARFSLLAAALASKMSNSDDDQQASGIPEWQRAKQSASDAPATPAAASDSDDGDTLAVARRFLDTDEVRSSSREKKAEFLRTKGVSEEDIQKLLAESQGETQQTEVSRFKTPRSQASSAKRCLQQTQESTQTTTTPQNSNTPPSTFPTSSSSSSPDRPPIVTYPEFLTKPQRPPPLVTTNGLLNTLYGFAGLSTLVYGASKYLVAPMVDSLTDARSELHDTTTKKLEELVHQLEKSVSVIPPAPTETSATNNNNERDAASSVPYTDAASEEDEDPAEIFHRDIGTQTTFPEGVPANDAADGAAQPKDAATEKPLAEQHATTLAKLAKSVSGLRDHVVSQSGDFEDIKAQIDVFRDDLDNMIYPTHDFVGGYNMFNMNNKSEPEDEIRKVRDNIRRIKGVLLSTRSFPASTR